MARTVPYDPTRAALLRPGDAGDYFAGWGGEGEGTLCVEMARLAYCRDRDKLERSLGRVGFALAAGPWDREGTFGWLATSNERSVLAFRGTDTDDPTDAIDDALFLPRSWGGLPGKVHLGFTRALDRVWDEVRPALAGISGRVVFTGHSLGAALATLAAALQPPAHLYTVGSPRVGDAEFAAAVGQRVAATRYVNCCDLVCRVPPRPYAHVGRVVYIDRLGRVREAPAKSVVERDRARGRRDYLTEYAWRTGNFVVRDLADHAPINYVAPLRSARTRSRSAP
jgi:hypothetical protein